MRRSIIASICCVAVLGLVFLASCKPTTTSKSWVRESKADGSKRTVERETVVQYDDSAKKIDLEFIERD